MTPAFGIAQVYKIRTIAIAMLWTDQNFIYSQGVGSQGIIMKDLNRVASLAKNLNFRRNVQVSQPQH
jgi:hypothetical protein